MKKGNARPEYFLDTAIKTFVPPTNDMSLKILDFGCGQGNLVRGLKSLGYDAYGCDLEAYWKESPERQGAHTFSKISRQPYRLPYADRTFDVLVSTSVLEHASNKEACFSETHRVLKTGGYAMHLYPGKWYLPREPHIYVPFVNMLWPNCPKWWLMLWAWLGIRNEFQRNKSWREVTEINVRYCEQGLSYWSNREYRKLSEATFGNYSAPMTFYIDHAYGGTANLFRKFPFKSFWGRLTGNIRMNFIIIKKMD